MLLKRLSEAFGVSGAEHEVRNILREELSQYGEIKTDTLGNLFVDKKGSLSTKLMLASHMDEVGLMITGIDKNGWLKFNTVGGIDPRVLVSKTVVVGTEKIKGIIGSKAIHLQEPNERNIPLKIRNLYIDIGANDKSDAERMVRIGDYAVFDTEFEVYGDNKIKGKAFDDRVGCYIISTLLKKQYKLPITAAFTVQEEVGLRGSAVAAYSVNPDIAIVVEGTFASDVPDTDETKYCTTIGKGPAITFMDRTYIANRNILDRVTQIAEKYNIPYQFKKVASGGTDGGRIQLTREGIPTIVIAVPCRYIHSPVSIASLEDIKNTINLVDAIITDIQERGVDFI